MSALARVAPPRQFARFRWFYLLSAVIGLIWMADYLGAVHAGPSGSSTLIGVLCLLGLLATAGWAAAIAKRERRFSWGMVAGSCGLANGLVAGVVNVVAGGLGTPPQTLGPYAGEATPQLVASLDSSIFVRVVEMAILAGGSAALAVAAGAVACLFVRSPKVQSEKRTWYDLRP